MITLEQHHFYAIFMDMNNLTNLNAVKLCQNLESYTTFGRRIISQDLKLLIVSIIDLIYQTTT